MDRAVIHIDMDAFFASVEQRDHEAYRGLPVIVGGAKEGRGVVSTASYEARKFGVHSAMPMQEAVRRCPQAIFLPVDMALYRSVSRQIMAIFQEYTPLVEAISLDEAFLDVTGSRKLFGSEEVIARTIKKRIWEELQLTASVGIANNKFLAKLASEMDKPDGFYIIRPEDMAEKVWPLSIKKMMGVGTKTEELLQSFRITTIGQLAQADPLLLERLLGKQGRLLSELAHGIDLRPVEPERIAKSIGRETTFQQDITERYTLETVLMDLCDDVAHSLRSNHFRGKTVTLKLRNRDFKTLTRAETLPGYTSSFEPIYEAICRLLRANYREGTPIRLIGLSVSHLEKEQNVVEQMDLFGAVEEFHRKDPLDQVLDQLNNKYGRQTVKRARQMAKERPEE